MKKGYSDLFLGVCALVIGVTCFSLYNSNPKQHDQLPSSAAAPLAEAPTLKYGFDVDEYVFEDYNIKRNAFMGDILMGFGVDFDKILKLEKEAEKVFSLRKIKAGKNITFVKSDECGDPLGFIYKPGLLDYVKFEFKDDVEVSRHEVPHERCIETASGVVTSNLWNAMVAQGLDGGLIDKMEDAVSQVNFHLAQPGDQFKLVYERVYVEGKPVRAGKIYSAAYKSGDNLSYGFYYENDKYKGYYDQDGTANKRTFLNAPLRFSRVSSVFNRNRFHPVLKRRRPHLGTDYAAPTGTPIFAVADGIVTHRSYTKGNGNYIKIKHDKTYQTQYLHMSRFARGVKSGTRVSQGQTIGYVGQTGLATGPHVCFRFWKNGRQIDHRRENFPPLNPMEESELPAYFEARDVLLAELRDVPFTEQPVAYAGSAAD